MLVVCLSKLLAIYKNRYVVSSRSGRKLLKSISKEIPEWLSFYEDWHLRIGDMKMLTQELKKIADNFILNLVWDLKTFQSRQKSIEENIIKLHIRLLVSQRKVSIKKRKKVIIHSFLNDDFYSILRCEKCVLKGKQTLKWIIDDWFWMEIPTICF